MSNENKRLKLAFLNTLILQDKRTSWKITNEYIAQTLQKHCGDIPISTQYSFGYYYWEKSSTRVRNFC